jgi:hypothetical protein
VAGSTDDDIIVGRRIWEEELGRPRDEQRDGRIVRAYQQGVEIKALSLRFGLRPHSVVKVLVKMGVYTITPRRRAGG